MTIAVVLSLVAALLFGAATPLSKALLGSLSPFQLAGLLYLGAAAGLLPGVIRRRSLRQVLALDRRNRALLAGAVLLGGIAGPVFLLFGLRLAAAASVSLWLNLELAATAVLGHILFHDHLSRSGWAAVGGTLAAAALLSWEGGVAGAQAGLLVAAACICWGFDNHLTALVDGAKPQDTTFVKGVVAGTTNLVIGLLLSRLEAGAFEIAAAVLVGVLAYGLSIVFYIMSAHGMGATRAQVVFASAPFFGVGLAVLMLGERFTVLQIVAAALLVLSILMMLRERHQHGHRHPAQDHEHWHRHTDGHHDHKHPEVPDRIGHVHRHQHEEIEHEHPHPPDIHHRHEH